MKIIIRKSKEKDLKIIQELNHQLFIHDKGFDSSLDMKWPFKKAGKEYFKNKINEKEELFYCRSKQ